MNIYVAEFGKIKEFDVDKSMRPAPFTADMIDKDQNNKIGRFDDIYNAAFDNIEEVLKETGVGDFDIMLGVDDPTIDLFAVKIPGGPDYDYYRAVEMVYVAPVSQSGLGWFEIRFYTDEENYDLAYTTDNSGWQEDRFKQVKLEYNLVFGGTPSSGQVLVDRNAWNHFVWFCYRSSNETTKLNARSSHLVGYSAQTDTWLRKGTSMHVDGPVLRPEALGNTDGTGIDRYFPDRGNNGAIRYTEIDIVGYTKYGLLWGCLTLEDLAKALEAQNGGETFNGPAVKAGYLWNIVIEQNFSIDGNLVRKIFNFTFRAKTDMSWTDSTTMASPAGQTVSAFCLPISDIYYAWSYRSDPAYPNEVGKAFGGGTWCTTDPAKASQYVKYVPSNWELVFEDHYLITKEDTPADSVIYMIHNSDSGENEIPVEFTSVTGRPFPNYFASTYENDTYSANIPYRFYPVGCVTDYVNLVWTDKYNETSTVSMDVPADEKHRGLMKPGRYLIHPQTNKVMIIEQLVYTSALLGNGKTLNISGRSLESILDRRVAFPGMGLNTLEFQASGGLLKAIGQIIDNYFCKPENFTAKASNDETKYYYYPERKIDFLRNDARNTANLKSEFNGMVNKTIAKDNILEVITNLCQSNNLGFRLEPENRFGSIVCEWVFSLYTGQDRSYYRKDKNQPLLLLSPNLDNVQEVSTEHNVTNDKNFVFCAKEKDAESYIDLTQTVDEKYEDDSGNVIKTALSDVKFLSSIKEWIKTRITDKSGISEAVIAYCCIAAADSTQGYESTVLKVETADGKEYEKDSKPEFSSLYKIPRRLSEAKEWSNLTITYRKNGYTGSLDPDDTTYRAQSKMGTLKPTTYQEFVDSTAFGWLNTKILSRAIEILNTAEWDGIAGKVEKRQVKSAFNGLDQYTSTYSQTKWLCATYSKSSLLTGLDRKEVFVDEENDDDDDWTNSKMVAWANSTELVTDTEEEEEDDDKILERLDKTAKKRAGEYVETKEITVKMDSTELVYKVDYDLGDIIQVDDSYGNSEEKIISEVCVSDDTKNGPMILPTFNEYHKLPSAYRQLDFIKVANMKLPVKFNRSTNMFQDMDNAELGSDGVIDAGAPFWDVEKDGYHIKNITVARNFKWTELELNVKMNVKREDDSNKMLVRPIISTGVTYDDTVSGRFLTPMLLGITRKVSPIQYNVKYNDKKFGINHDDETQRYADIFFMMNDAKENGNYNSVGLGNNKAPGSDLIYAPDITDTDDPDPETKYPVMSDKGGIKIGENEYVFHINSPVIESLDNDTFMVRDADGNEVEKKRKRIYSETRIGKIEDDKLLDRRPQSDYRYNNINGQDLYNAGPAIGDYVFEQLRDGGTPWMPFSYTDDDQNPHRVMWKMFDEFTYGDGNDTHAVFVGIDEGNDDPDKVSQISYMVGDRSSMTGAPGQYVFYNTRGHSGIHNFIEAIKNQFGTDSETYRIVANRGHGLIPDKILYYNIGWTTIIVMLTHVKDTPNSQHAFVGIYDSGNDDEFVWHSDIETGHDFSLVDGHNEVKYNISKMPLTIMDGQSVYPKYPDHMALVRFVRTNSTQTAELFDISSSAAWYTGNRIKQMDISTSVVHLNNFVSQITLGCMESYEEVTDPGSSGEVRIPKSPEDSDIGFWIAHETSYGFNLTYFYTNKQTGNVDNQTVTLMSGWTTTYFTEPRKVKLYFDGYRLAAVGLKDKKLTVYSVSAPRRWHYRNNTHWTYYAISMSSNPAAQSDTIAESASNDVYYVAKANNTTVISTQGLLTILTSNYSYTSGTDLVASGTIAGSGKNAVGFQIGKELTGISQMIVTKVTAPFQAYVMNIGKVSMDLWYVQYDQGPIGLTRCRAGTDAPSHEKISGIYSDRFVGTAAGGPNFGAFGQHDNELYNQNEEPLAERYLYIGGIHNDKTGQFVRDLGEGEMDISAQDTDDGVTFEELKVYTYPASARKVKYEYPDKEHSRVKLWNYALTAQAGGQQYAYDIIDKKVPDFLRYTELDINAKTLENDLIPVEYVDAPEDTPDTKKYGLFDLITKEFIPVDYGDNAEAVLIEAGGYTQKG